ncbi:hypothetical protein J8J14_22945 [Roseomonas sp. SSH11]|uniref:Uncharacterized protein n=1 Tax=Pararoseomonas baculiformis TaxID=2820812 RepID=A0ABS4AKS8_9PROT|nr:hypothetical protein [Pararoseomonas baculiformis]MBP0447620.1 hypothetical protein [Pararoseomonas baculiformis]
MSSKHHAVLPVLCTLFTAWRLLSGTRHRLIRDAALWLRAPADRRPTWRER